MNRTSEPISPTLIGDFRPMVSILGEFAQVYVTVAAAVLVVGLLGMLVHAASPMRARYAKMAAASVVWPLAAGWLLVRPQPAA